MLPGEQLPLAHEFRHILLTGTDQIGERGLVVMKPDRTPKGRVSSTMFRIGQCDERVEHGGGLQPATTRVNTPVVSAVVGHWLYPATLMTVDKNLDYNAAWLREMRQMLGWSTTDAANRAREQARDYGDTIKLSQQLISKFENGHLKSNPRWLAYLQTAMAVFISEKGLSAGRLWELRLPKEIADYYRARVARRQDEYLNDDLRDELLFDDDLTSDDRSDLALIQRLSRDDRAAIRVIMVSLVGDRAT